MATKTQSAKNMPTKGKTHARYSNTSTRVIRAVACHRRRECGENERLRNHQPAHPPGNEVKLRLESLTEPRDLRQDMRDVARVEGNYFIAGRRAVLVHGA